MNRDDALQIIKRMIDYIGDDPEREGLIDTPDRVVKSWDELFKGYKQNVEDVLTFFESDAKELVLLKNIEFQSTCEHHMLPFYGQMHIAYIPNGRVVGISKLVRVAEIFARRLQIQERLTSQITNALDKYLSPLGSACVIEAKHSCMVCRGVEKQNSVMVTSSLTGEFLDNTLTRSEFMNLIK